MAKIRVLPETVQNKIAAGEVIERPASVVKELAENAMDAGAKLVAVDLEDGGHRLIRVADDGHGMDEDDLVACMQRHATSKISSADDIFRISTFGFRGEALPSIGSVSRMHIVTCPEGSGEGRELQIEAGQMVRLAPAAPRRGTQVEVRDIFFNTPARRKFLRQPASENTRANEILTRLALGNPEIGFRLQTNGRITLSVKPAASLRDRIGELFGEDMPEKLVPFSRDIADGLSVSGFFGRPPLSRRSSKDIYVLVNRRWIRYYGLGKAVSDAFQGILPPREFPFAVINLTVDPARVDVNVHPAKEEVRFEQERILVGGVRHALGDALASVAAVPTVSGFSLPADSARRPEKVRSLLSVPREGGSVQQTFDLPAKLSQSRNAAFSAADFIAARDRLQGIAAGVSVRAPATVGNEPNSSDAGTPEDAVAEPDSPEGVLTVGAAGSHRILGQAGGKYILVDGPDGLLLVDPHALHERWNFDRLTEQRLRGTEAVQLLLPLTLRLSPAEAAAADEAVPALAEYGFAFRLTEPTLLEVTAAPTFIPESKLENLLRQVLADTGEADGAVEAARERLLASLACRSSVLLGKNLPEEEMLSLLDRFFNQGQLPTCPHGRPTAIRIGWDELASRFGR